MSRAVLLPCPGDPYIAQLWLSSWKRFWGNAGQLYVMINTQLEHPVVDYTREVFEDAGAKVFYHHNMMSHGPAITRLLNECHEDHVFVAEDDFCLLQPGHVERWFKMVETGQVGAVVSPRGCTGADIIGQTANVYKLHQLTAAGIRIGRQTNFWPSLVVIDRESLLNTDQHFDGYRFKAGKPIPQLHNYAPPKDVGGDTFVWASIQLRGQGLTFHYENQHRLIDIELGGMIETAPWVHLGSSSTSLNGGLLDENMRPLGHRSLDRPRQFQPVPDEGIRKVFEQKTSWWKLACEKFPIPKGHPAHYFNEIYLDAVERVTKGNGFRPNMMQRCHNMFSRLLRNIL